jgi:hypothetical protein
MDYNIDFIIKLFSNNFDALKQYIDTIRDSLPKLVKYLKEFYCPPVLIDSKTQTMYKNRKIQFPIKVSPLQLNNFNSKNSQVAVNKTNQIKEIYNSIFILIERINHVQANVGL